MEHAQVESLGSYAEECARFRPLDASDRAALSALCAAYRRGEAESREEVHVGRAIDAALAGDPLVRIFMIELLEASEAPSEHAAMLVGYLAVSVGFSLEAGGRDAFIDELYIEPFAQGRGLGQRALRFAEQVCADLGAVRVCLEVARKNSRARALYERSGYAPHERSLMSKRLR